MNPPCASSFNPLSRRHPPPPPPTTTSPPPFTREYCSCCARSLKTSPHDKNSPMTHKPKKQNHLQLESNLRKQSEMWPEMSRSSTETRAASSERERKLERRTTFGYNIFDCHTVPKEPQKTETIFIVAMFSNNFCFCKFSICCTQNTNSLYLDT